MSRIEISMEEFQGMKSKIQKLELALNSVSKEASIKKEKLEQIKALYEDLKNESLYNRMFSWKQVIKPLKDLCLDHEEIATKKQ